MVKQGAGSLTLGGANSYSGGTTVSGGVLQLAGPTALGSASGALTVNAGTLDLNGQQPDGRRIGRRQRHHYHAARAPPRSPPGAAVPPRPSAACWWTAAARWAWSRSAAGTLTLADANNAYSGGTSINGGVLASPAPTTWAAAT